MTSADDEVTLRDSEARDRLIALVADRDRRGALAEAAELITAGATTAEVVAVLAAVQFEVGRRWEAGTWTTAHEHAATAIIEAVLSATSTMAVPPDDRGRVVVACVEEEWHSLPARMISEVLRSAGFDVTFLGSSLPSEDVGSFLHEVDPAGVVLSCSVAMNLPGAARVIDACHAAGARVLVGGRGFGPTAARAERLRADAWAASPGDALEILGSWVALRSTPILSDRQLGGEHILLAEIQEALVDSAMAALEVRLPMMSSFSPRQLSRTRTDYAFIVRFLEAAVLVDDETVFTEFLEWLRGILVRAGLPPTVLPLSLEVLRACLPDTLILSARLLMDGAARLS